VVSCSFVIPKSGTQAGRFTVKVGTFYSREKYRLAVVDGEWDLRLPLLVYDQPPHTLCEFFGTVVIFRRGFSILKVSAAETVNAV
jgi:hypothetical protein